MDERNVHGGEVLRLARELGVAPDSLLDFSSNADSLVDPITARLAARTPVEHHRYPDDDCTELVARVAAHEGLATDEILVGNGSSELIFLALAALPVRSAAIVAPVFSEYERACRALDIEVRRLVLRPEHGFDFTDADVDRLRALRADALIVCQPNNPTGALHDMARVLRGTPHPFVLVDNTYREFLHPTDAYAPNFLRAYRALAAPHARVLSICSFTKYFYCTGVRLGYVAGDAETIGRLRAKKAPWTVWRFAEQLGSAFLDNIGEYRAARRGFDALRSSLADALRATGAFSAVLPGHANFLTARLADPAASDRLARFLLARSLVVRQCDNIPAMPPGFLRMQVRADGENRRLVTAIKDFAQNAP
ncbi:MAG: aminotransferase class I/II-fold pyridoxal phosphate-dependent enzyme [Desulfovibrionaceae bacterium]|jgi:threonine-phosphate decarboxylase|nr:aminotransferase class I/II-fold pyridoxal phosphate-dependent enzyme [Desulfovibrionaceae bacterium]